MAFSGLGAGALSARIIVEETIPKQDGKGQEVNQWRPLYGGRIAIPAKWRRSRSSTNSALDRVENNRLGVTEQALVQVRYNRRITASCRVRRIGDEGGVWYIVGSPERSPDGAWLEFYVERGVRP